MNLSRAVPATLLGGWTYANVVRSFTVLCAYIYKVNTSTVSDDICSHVGVHKCSRYELEYRGRQYNFQVKSQARLRRRSHGDAPSKSSSLSSWLMATAMPKQLDGAHRGWRHNQGAAARLDGVATHEHKHTSEMHETIGSLLHWSQHCVSDWRQPRTASEQTSKQASDRSVTKVLVVADGPLVVCPNGLDATNSTRPSPMHRPLIIDHRLRRPHDT